jgi:hypothetical protein
MVRSGQNARVPGWGLKFFLAQRAPEWAEWYGVGRMPECLAGDLEKILLRGHRSGQNGTEWAECQSAWLGT